MSSNKWKIATMGIFAKLDWGSHAVNMKSRSNSCGFTVGKSERDIVRAELNIAKNTNIWISNCNS
jgi:hypothetical protein